MNTANTLNGKTEEQVRKEIAAVIFRRNLSLEDFFEKAAKKHAPHLKSGEVRRKVSRYKEGGAAPDFVKKHVLEIASASPGQQ